MNSTRWPLRLAMVALLAGSAFSITIPISDANAGTYTSLVNPKATAEAKGLMRYLSSIYGKNVLSGHQMSYTISDGTSELAKIKTWTGKVPALRGFDFMDVINSWGSPHADSALKWGRAGGVVTLNWHWRLAGKDFYSPAFHKGGTVFPAGDPATNATINADLVKLGDALQKFADAKIPVLWRPLHEPPGDWFWWHNGGADQFKKLWIHMYDYLVNTRKLNNLIWVYSSSDGGTAKTTWYPGNQYVDVIGVDRYKGDWGTFFNNLKTMSNDQRMEAVTENQQFPDWNAKYPYLWTLSWNNEIFAKLTQSDFTGLYNNAHTINLDALPTVAYKMTWDKMVGPAGIATRKALSGAGDRVTVFSVDGRPVQVVEGKDLVNFRQSGRLCGLRAGVYLAVDRDGIRKVLVGE